MDAHSEARRLVDTYTPLIMRLGYSYLRSKEDAEDLCQETLIKLVRHGGGFSDAGHEKAWVVRVAINACKDRLKSADRSRVVGLDSVAEPAATENEGGGGGRRRAVVLGRLRHQLGRRHPGASEQPGVHGRPRGRLVCPGAEDSSSYVYAYDTNPDDSTVCYVEQTKLRSPAKLTGRTSQVRFNRIVATYHGESALPGGNNRVTIAEGRWEFRFIIDYEELGVELCESGPVESPGWSGMALTSARLTPLALQLEFDVKRDGSQFIEVSKHVKEAVGSCEIVLDDGSALSFELSACPSNTSGNGESLRCEVNIPFEGIINIGAVRSVKLGGVTLKP